MTAAVPNDLARALRAFFADHLPRVRGTSPHTIQSYRDSLVLLLRFVATQTQRSVHLLDMDDLGPQPILAFLPAPGDRPAQQRRHPQRTPHRDPRVLPILRHGVPRTTRTLSTRPCRPVQAYRQPPRGVPRARGGRSRPWHRRSRHRRRAPRLCAARHHVQHRRAGRGNRRPVRRRPAVGHPRASHLHGKGRKERVCPLWPQTADLLRALLVERGREPQSDEPVFRNHRGTRLTRFGVRYLLQKYCSRAQATVPALRAKRLHPHSMRHSTAVHLLRAGVDIVTISQWLGHASVTTTNRYATVDLDMKRKALAKAAPPPSTPQGWPCGAQTRPCSNGLKHSEQGDR